MGKATNLKIQEAFDLVLGEFRERIVPNLFAEGDKKPHWSEVPLVTRCDMFEKYLKHLQAEGVITAKQQIALELKYLEDVFNVTIAEEDSNGN